MDFVKSQLSLEMRAEHKLWIYSLMKRVKLLNKSLLNLTNYGNIYTNEQSTLITQRRGGTGSKMKLQSGECVIESVADTNLGTLMAFSNLGKSYSYPLSELPLNTFINVSEILKLADSEYITNITSFDKASASKFIVFVTKNGLVKKTAITE